MKIFHYPKCSSCRNALKFLRDKGLEIEEFDISNQTPSATQLRQMLTFYQGDIKKLFIVSGQKYRELQLKDKLSCMSHQEAISLLGSEGMLIKRPFLIGDGFGLVGFKKDEWEKVFSDY